MSNFPSNLTPQELWELNQQLQRQVERGVARHQQLIQLRNELDDELERYHKLNEFNTQALETGSPQELVLLALDAYAHTFQLPRIAIYEHNTDTQQLTLLGQLGFSEESIVQQAIVTVPKEHQAGIFPQENSLSELVELTGLKEALIGIYHPPKLRQSPPLVAISGFATEDAHFMQSINQHLLPSYSTMTHELGLYMEQLMLMQKLKEEINERKAYQSMLEEAKIELENRVIKRTTDLENSNMRLQHEISERQAIESELLRSNTDLEQFAYIASHDLKTPLRSIGGFAQLIGRRYTEQLDEQAHEYLQFIFTNVNQLNNLIDDLLLYSRIDSLPDQVEEVDLNKLLSDILDELKGTIAGLEVDIKVDELPKIYGKAVQLKHLFRNLIDNAIKFRRPEVACCIKVSAEQKNDRYCFRVRDNGIGIDAKFQNTIFEVFQRLHSVEQYQGTGLGLSICQRIVQRFNGRIWFEPRNPEAGTDFLFTIPVQTLDHDYARLEVKDYTGC